MEISKNDLDKIYELANDGSMFSDNFYYIDIMNIVEDVKDRSVQLESKEKMDDEILSSYEQLITE